jgi:DNA-directed RNA polymerase subunit L
MFRNIHQSNDPNKRFTFEAHGVDLAIINGIRRIILTDIPVVGFQGEENPSLKVLANNGPLHNEFMLHRLGMIPIHFNADEVETFAPEDYLFELNVENTGVSMLNVTSADFKVENKGRAMDHKRLFPPDSLTKDYVLITRLRPGERFHVQGHAIRSTARSHASFNPVSLCTFSFMSNGKPAADLSILDKERAFAKNEFGDPMAILFSIETETALTPGYLVKKSFDIIIAKIRNLMGILSDVATRTDIGVEFNIIGEDDTLGNIIQSLMHNYFIREKHQTSKNKMVTYVGYYPPHPLETSVVVKICIDDHDNVTTEEYIDTVHEACARIITQIDDIAEAWTTSL